MILSKHSFICDHPLYWFDALAGCAELTEDQRIELLDRYSSFPRAYHTLHHIAVMWQTNIFLGSNGHAPDLMDNVLRRKLARAICYHDAVYDPRSTTNEEDSAKLAEFPDPDKQWVTHAIRTSKSHFARRPIATQDDALLEWFIGLNLVSLAAPWEQFNTHSLLLRAEFGHLSDADWDVGRKSFFESALRERPIFQHPVFESLFENAAIENLERSLDEMAQSSLC